MRIEPREKIILEIEFVIVEQDAHAHAALGGGEQAFEQKAADVVVVEDVVLDVDGAFGQIGHGRARHQRRNAVVEQAEPGLSGMRGLRGGIGTPERGVLRPVEGA